MNIVLLTTGDDLMSSIFWAEFKKRRGIPITKIVVLPDRADVGFQKWAGPIPFLWLLGLAGTLRLLNHKFRSTKVLAKDVCDNLVVLETQDSSELTRELKKSRIDVLISVGAPVILKPEILSLAEKYSLNLHNADIRKFRGHFSTFWEIATGEDLVCVTLHEMTEKVDAGIIYDLRCKDKSELSGFQDVMFWKKKNGGAMLAKALDQLDSSKLLEVADGVSAVEKSSKYYPFPRLRDLFKFNY